ncbi:hypothetical protein GOV06_02985 [Candidatus Woesearchaeota archaeon]|nr:hypothetical protein [Candidatus Woesearchaeota archaeon]
MKNLSLIEKIGAFVLGFIVIGILFYGISSLSKGYLTYFPGFVLYWGLWLIGLLGLAVIAYFIYKLIKQFKNWQSWRLWLKGGTIGIGIYTLIFIITFIFHNVTSKLPKIILMILIPGGYIFNYTLGSVFRITNDIIEISVAFMIHIIIGFLIGAIIGLIVEKVRK